MNFKWIGEKSFEHRLEEKFEVHCWGFTVLSSEFRVLNFRFQVSSHQWRVSSGFGYSMDFFK
jgi:hypothetical protein